MDELSRRELLNRGLNWTLAGGVVSVGLANLATAAEPAAGPATAPAAAPARPDPYADAVFEPGAPPLPEDGSFTIVVLPDTQNYKDQFAAGYMAQTEWIAANVRDRRIAAVLHLGDITNNNAPEQWATAREAMGKLDGVVPYFMVPGNHDLGPDGKSTDRSCGMSEAFPVAKFRALPTFGGVYDREPERIENSYHLFSAGGRDFLVLCLEFGPRRDVVRWANEVAARYPQREAILITHAFVYSDDTRYDWKKYGPAQKWNPHGYRLAELTGDDVTDGQDLWESLVSRHENFILTLNGHVLNDGLGLVTDKTPGGRDVHQILVNFQMKPHGGDGWLRLMEFKADGRTIDVVDYSPTLDRQNIAPSNRFRLVTAPVAKA